MQTAWAGRAMGWATLAALLVLGFGGAAAAPTGVLLGVPSLGCLLAAVIVAAAVAAFAGRDAARPSLGFLPIPLLVLAGLGPLGLRALSGPPLLAVALAGIVLALAEVRVPAARLIFFPVALALYLGVAARARTQVGPEGDEPHYLMVADSLLHDHDLDLTQDYAEGRYRAFHPKDLAPHYRVRGTGGEIYSLHALGLSLLVLPAYAVGGYPAVSFFMAFLAALLAWEIRGLLRDAWGDAAWDLADGVAWMVAASPPLLHYAGLVFTEIPAALVVAVVLRRGRDVAGLRTALGLGLAMAFLPWLNVRYAAVAVILAFYVLAGRPTRSRAAAVVLPGLASALGLAVYHHALYGFFDPRRVYGARPELSLGTLPEALPGLFFDQEFGLLIYAPAFALAVPGLARLARERGRLAVTGAALCVVVVATAASWPMWRGGFNPPARFLVPLVPVLAVGLAAWLRRGVSAGAALLLGWGLWTGLAGGVSPRLVHRDRDGTAPLFREASGALEWTRLLPGYVLEEPGRRRLTLVWGVALGMAAMSRRRGPAATALTSLGLALAATAAAGGADLRTEGRDAVRLVGRPALAVPGWRWTAAAPGSWTAADLDWGPLYEPHRHPEGATLGDRLALPEGAYALELEVDPLGESGVGPQLEVRPEPAGAPRWHPLERPAPTQRRVLFEVRRDERAVTLLIEGGEPLMLRAVNLLAVPRSNP